MPRKTTRRTTEVNEHDRLSTLPPELIELIAEWLSARDLLSFRLICRSFNACSSRPYVQKYVATRPFLLFNIASLEKLEALIEDPDTRRHMACITLSHAGLLTSAVDYDRRQELLDLQSSSSMSRDRRARKREQMAAHRRMWKQETTIRDHDAFFTLRDVIWRMQSHGINVGIKCTNTGIKTYSTQTTNPEDPAPWGYDRVCDTLGYRHCMTMETTDHDAFGSILDALAATKHQPPVFRTR